MSKETEPMAATPRTNRVPVLSLRPDQALIGVPASENGVEVTHFFAEEDDAHATADETLRAALAAIGSWSDLGWQEIVAALERIRHESEPTPPIEDL
jgi:hypothetical protein